MNSEYKVMISEDMYRRAYAVKAELSNLMHEKFGCVIELKGPTLWAASSQSEPPSVFYQKKNGDITVSVWKDDMTQQVVDAVVNAANERLEHAGGIALALARAGGPRVKSESRSFIEKYGLVKTGSVVVTSGGKLPCKHIIHAVGPMWSERNRSQCQTELKEVIRNVLCHILRDPNIRSVSIPAVSSGIFGFPLDNCAEIIVRTVQEFCQWDKCDHVREIRFVNHDDKTVSAMRRACEKVLGPSETLKGNYAAALDRHGPHSSHQGPYSAQQGSYSTRQETHSSRQGPHSTHHGPPAVASFSINGLNLYLSTGCIEDQTTTIIVNSISESLDLSLGQLSKAILNKAGYEMQKHINQFKSKQNHSVITTSGYRLLSSYVYHVILRSYDIYYSKQVSYLFFFISYTLPVLPVYADCTPCIHSPDSLYTLPGLPVYTPRTPCIHSQDSLYTLPELPVYTPRTPCVHSQDSLCTLPGLPVYTPCTPCICSPYSYMLHAMTEMTEVIYKCLFMAQSDNHPSISFPCLGIGALGFPKETVAETMTKTIVNFAREAERRLDVCIVIHPSDISILKIFENQFKRLQVSLTRKSPMLTGDQTAGSGMTAEETCFVITGLSHEDVKDAKFWLMNTMQDSEAVWIKDNHLLLCGKREHDMFSELSGVEITENLQDETASLKISGRSEETIRAAVLVERTLIKVQEECALRMEEELFQSAVQWFFKKRNQKYPYPARANVQIEKAFLSKRGQLEVQEPLHQVDLQSMSAASSEDMFQLHRENFFTRDYLKDVGSSHNALFLVTDVIQESQEFIDRKREFDKANLTIVQMEKIQNKFLAAIYQSKKAVVQAKGASQPLHRLYQRVPGKYRKLICRTGFHRLYSSGEDCNYGAGIYFKKNLTDITKGKPKPREADRLVYIFQAEVVTGRFTMGNRSYILPPPVGSDDLELYDSVVNSVSNPETFVIFDSHCALPQYLFTCKWKNPQGS
ncbi:protein mono-ADP-ribosyltransferase PARP9 [Pelobates fuscus]|uniref:protein mono-ADP-ribosyltransferase PARP9 n=1 Tax=Pelobates fuscus TaxID=191477 RepID=UPI002FE48D89